MAPLKHMTPFKGFFFGYTYHV